MPRGVRPRPGPHRNADPNEGERIAALVDGLRESYPDRTFETWDERYTTVIAQRALLEGDVSRRERRGKVDKVAAALILQSWLEYRRS